MRLSVKLMWTLLIAFAGAMVLPAPAQADFPDHGLYIGAYGGYTLKIGNWDLGNTPEVLYGDIQPKSAPVLGLRLGYHILPRLICEIGGGFLPITSTASGKNTGLKGDVDLYFHLMRGNFSPFAGLGAGTYSTMSGGDLGGDADFQAHVALGVRGLVTPKIALRAEARGNMVDNYSSFGWGENLELSAGVDFYLSGGLKKVLPPADADNDGVPDSVDKCPDKPGSAEMNGCPDSDKDGITDAMDKCPNDPGDAAHEGCPVRDRDGDGVLDGEDQCQDQAGPRILNGCPDRDGDGIADKEDECPDQAGTKMTRGCPDKDGDGVADKDDKCPDVTGLPDYQGCVPEAVAKFTGAIKGINFKTGSSEILPVSYSILDQTVAILNEYKTLRIRIEGHTDNVGKPEVNQKLSESRAESVKTYILSKGVDFSRIETAGYGDSRSVQSNKTAKGRAANRRIEFTIMGQ